MLIRHRDVRWIRVFSALAAALLVLLGAARQALASPIRVDATALTASQFGVAGFGAHPTSSVQTFDLAPGSYTFTAPSAPADATVGFTVSAGGTVGYAPGLDVGVGGFLAGAGTTTLTVQGFAITVDPSALTGTYLYVDQETNELSHAPVALRLIPGSYSFVDDGGGGNAFAFAVTGAGTVSYAPAYDVGAGGFVSGAGTTTLTVLGFAVTIDASALTGPYLFVTQETGDLPHAPITVRFLPGNYQFVDDGGSGNAFDFSITGAGTVSYAAAYDVGAGGFLAGDGTATLTVLGFAITIDASALTGPYLFVTQETGDLPHAPVTVRFLPGNYQFVDDDGYAPAFDFSVTGAGTVSYAAAYDVGAGGFLAGEGTATLTVLGFAITIDASALTGPYLYVTQETGYLPHAPVTVHFLPGNYQFVDFDGYSPAFDFSITGAGTVSYAPAYDLGAGGFLAGEGTTTLTVLGFAITIDASALTGPHLYVTQETGYLPHAPVTVHFLPGNYQFVDFDGFSPAFDFSVTGAGKVSYAAAYDLGAGGFLGGAGTSTLAVRGFSVALCAASVSSAHFYLTQVTPSQPTSEILFATLLPGAYEVDVDVDGGGLDADSTFNVALSDTGVLTIAPALAGFVTGQGQRSLAVLGYEVPFTASPAVFGASVQISGVPGCVATGQLHALSLVPGDHTIASCSNAARETFALDDAGAVSVVTGAGVSFGAVVASNLSAACSPSCVTIQRGLAGQVEDALIASGNGTDGSTTTNYGASGSLTAGAVGAGQRQGLLRFDLSAIPSGAVITSATATLHVLLGGAAPVRVHQATAPWQESTVTWGSFGESYLPAVAATFPAGSPSSADLGALVQAWVSGAAANDGVLMERDLTGSTVFASSEVLTQSLRPALEVCYH